MAFGVPTVVTSIAAEGMHLVHEESAYDRSGSRKLRGRGRAALD